MLTSSWLVLPLLSCQTLLFEQICNTWAGNMVHSCTPLLYKVFHISHCLNHQYICNLTLTAHISFFPLTIAHLVYCSLGLLNYNNMHYWDEARFPSPQWGRFSFEYSTFPTDRMAGWISFTILCIGSNIEI